MKIVWAFLVFGIFAAQGRAASLEIYGRLPQIEDVALSPSGMRIALVRTVGVDRVVAIKTLGESSPVKFLRAGDQKLRGIRWADDDHLMIETSVTTVPLGLIGRQGEWFTLQIYDVEKGRVRPVPDIEQHRLRSDPLMMNVISGDPMIRHVDGSTVMFVPGAYAAADHILPSLFRVDLQSGSDALFRKGSEATRRWLVDETGQVAAEENYDEQDQRWSIVVRHKDILQELASGHEAVDVPGITGFGPDADTLLVKSADRGDGSLQLLSLHDGKTSAPPTGKSSEPILDRYSDRLIGAVHNADDPQYVFLDPTFQRYWDSVAHYYTGSRVRLVSHSEDLTKMVVLVDGPREGYVYVLVDMLAGRSSPIGSAYEGIVSPLEVRQISYAAQDGLTIPAYLTLPHGPPAKNLPLIVLVHGGPASRDTAWFDWWAQALADQGYAVLQPNYRGSSLGWSFLSAGFGQWGRKMQTDLSDGVRYLVSQGIADGARVCIVGGSYGGYAALAGVTLDPGVYRCAVSVAGIADLKSMLRWINEKHLGASSPEQRYWDRFLGVSGPDDAALDAISPIKHVDAVTAPVLLIHGKDDTVVPFDQSSVMYDALRRAQKPVELVTLQREDHWLSRNETRLQMLQATVTFLRAQDPPDETAGATAQH